MNGMRFSRFIPAVFLILFSSCASEKSLQSRLPSETSFDEFAAHGAPVLITLRLDSGEDLLFMVDTGSPKTYLNKSLEPKLGKRLGAKSVTWGFYGKREDGIYPAPALFLNNVRLKLGNQVQTDAMGTKYGGVPLMGILGMDTLRHYCIQLDFNQSKMRFFNSDDLKDQDLGKAYRLYSAAGGIFTYADLLDRKQVFFRIDSGLVGGVDFMLKPDLFESEMREKHPFGQADTNFMSSARRNHANDFEIANRPVTAWARLPGLQFGGRTYTNVFVAKDMAEFASNENIIGLRFLARNLVTFDFPHHVVYLKPTSVKSPHGK